MYRSKFLLAPEIDEPGLSVTTLIDVLNTVAAIGADTVTLKGFSK